jgi:leader peptidase (prepilin peptidase)/N-methyltransferase
MPQIVLAILIGIVAGALLAIPVQLICSFLLRRRSLPWQLERKYRIILFLSMALVGGAIGWRAGLSFRALYLLLLLVVAAVAFITDALHRIIPNEAVLAIILLAAAFGFAGAIPFQIVSSLIGLAGCFVLFFVPGLFGKSIGAGDVKLAAAMGFALGIAGSLYAIVGMGVLILGYILVSHSVPMAQRLKSMIPMGPFLSVALIIVSLL